MPFQVIAVGTPQRDADPITRLQYELAEMPFELPTREEIREALEVVVRLEAGIWPTGPDGRCRDVDGLPAWLYWLAHMDEEVAA